MLTGSSCCLLNLLLDYSCALSVAVCRLCGMGWIEVTSLDGSENYLVEQSSLLKILASTKSPDELSLLMQVENVGTGDVNVITALRTT